MPQLSRQCDIEQIDQWNRMESPEINSCNYGQLTYNKGGQTIQQRKVSLFSKWCWEKGTGTYKRMKIIHLLTSYVRKTQNGFKT